MRKTKLSLVVAMALALAFGTSVALAKSDNAKAQSKEKSKKTVNLKNFEKPDKAKGQTNAQVHKVKTTQAVQALEQVAVEQETSGNTEVSDDIEQVVTTTETALPETVEAIEEVETEGTAKKFVLGPDYKNLGQLQRTLVQQRNEIRKLAKTMTEAGDRTELNAMQAQLEVMMQERARVMSVIEEGEDSFSLFGWVSRIMNGYVPVTEQAAEEEQLVTDVTQAIENADSTVPETTTPGDAAAGGITTGDTTAGTETGSVTTGGTTAGDTAASGTTTTDTTIPAPTPTPVQ